MIILKLATMGLLTMIAASALIMAPAMDPIAGDRPGAGEGALAHRLKMSFADLAMRASNERSFPRDVMHE